MEEACESSSNGADEIDILSPMNTKTCTFNNIVEPTCCTKLRIDCIQDLEGTRSAG